MLPAQRDISIYAGDDFEMTVRLRDKTPDGYPGAPIDVWGSTAHAQIRSSKNSNQILATFVCDIPGPDQPGVINMSLDSSETSGLVSGVYDLEVEFVNGIRKTFLAGNATVTAEVTRGV